MNAHKANMNGGSVQIGAGWIIVVIAFIHVAVTFVDNDQLSLRAIALTKASQPQGPTLVVLFAVAAVAQFRRRGALRAS
jgi:hypothetical protein